MAGWLDGVDGVLLTSATSNRRNPRYVSSLGRRAAGCRRAHSKKSPWHPGSHYQEMIWARPPPCDRVAAPSGRFSRWRLKFAPLSYFHFKWLVFSIMGVVKTTAIFEAKSCVCAPALFGDWRINKLTQTRSSSLAISMQGLNSGRGLFAAHALLPLWWLWINISGWVRATFVCNDFSLAILTMTSFMV